MSEYEYKYTEQSVDIREWTITSPRKLTEEEVQEIGMDWGSFTEGETSIVDRKSTRLNSSHLVISYAVFCLKKKKK